MATIANEFIDDLRYALANRESVSDVLNSYRGRAVRTEYEPEFGFYERVRIDWFRDGSAVSGLDPDLNQMHLEVFLENTRDFVEQFWVHLDESDENYESSRDYFANL